MVLAHSLGKDDPWSSLVEGGEGSYLPKWEAVVFMKIQSNRDRAITKFV